MDKNAVKKFSVNARRKLIDSVSQKAYGLGISTDEIKEVEQIPNGSRIKINNDYVYLTDIETEHRERLIDQIEYKGYEQVMEEVAYTWFNRIIAIRFMEVNEYLPTRVRVLSSEDENKVEPDAVTQALDLVEDLGLNTEKIYKYQDNNDIEGLFKYIFIKQCNVLGKIMPVMFEKIQDYTELLLPDNLLVEGSVITDLISDIEEDNFKEQVEIIGWLYQYYISEKKDEVFNGLKKNKKITKENIPAATQLFTPDWIVKYMVENSLGRLWLEGHPNETLKSEWKYYLEECEQEPDVEKDLEKIREESKKLSPEDITVLDPAMGSGHILVYAFDVLYKIYLSAGYSEREIPRLILEKNLYGIDIDDRAGQLAYFALIMKARSYSRRFFRNIEINVLNINIYSFKETNLVTQQEINYFSDGNDYIEKNLKRLIDLYIDSKEYGSILMLNDIDINVIEKRLKQIYNDKSNLLNSKIKEKILGKLSNIIAQLKIMTKKYDICITNPPYMGNRGMERDLSLYLKKEYKDYSSDLYITFIEVCRRMSKDNSYTALIVMQSWMFLSSYSNFRKSLLEKVTISSLIQIGYNSFPELNSQVAHAMAFIFRNKKVQNYKGIYIDLNTDRGINEDKNLVYLEKKDKKKKYINTCEEFLNIPNNIIAYNCSKRMKLLLTSSKSITNHSDFIGSFNKTADNEKYLRYSWEVNNNQIGMYRKWCMYSKGGNFRKYYGNLENIVDWSDEAREFYKNNKTSNLLDKKYWYKEGITYNLITTLGSSFRYLPKECISDMGGPTIYDVDDIDYAIGFLNSKVSYKFLTILNPTINVQVKDIKNIPYLYDKTIKNKIITLVKENIEISKLDWNSFEISLDYKEHPLIQFKYNKLELSFNNWISFTNNKFDKLKSNEEELNRIFINIYRLQDELTPEVEDKDITIRKADRNREMKSLISYAVGCMMGRYSLDEEGLVFAGGEFNINRYKTFKADKDAIIPIIDMEYFEDDIVSRFVEFVKVVFGEETLEENLNYIADTECFKRKSNETSRECLRRYFLKGFMEDHIKVYQKRPIYWMFDSGKQNGFKALIYMHRYDENMVAKVRADYLHVLQRKYESEINRLDNDINSDILSAKEKTAAKKRKEKIQKQLAECKQYDQVIAHVAHQRIVIDLDDGVKVNYQKFQGVEVPQGDGKKDLKQDLLFKVKM